MLTFFSLFLFTTLYGTMYLHLIAIRLKPLTGNLNNIDYRITLTPVDGWDILSSK